MISAGVASGFRRRTRLTYLRATPRRPLTALSISRVERRFVYWRYTGGRRFKGLYWVGGDVALFDAGVKSDKDAAQWLPSANRTW